MKKLSTSSQEISILEVRDVERIKNEKSRYSYLITLTSVFGKIFAGFAGIWLVIEVVSYFTPGKFIAEYRMIGLGTFVISGIIIGLSWELLSVFSKLSTALEQIAQLQEQNKMLQEQMMNPRSNENETSILEELRQAYAQRNWEEVITLGGPLSRPLWLTGRYQLRLHIGSLVEGAAAFSSRFDVQASALIDDLGWTNIAIRRYNEGINYLLHGLKVSEDNEFFGLVCRANRHLAGAYLKLGNIEKANLYANESAESLNKVKDQTERKQLEAGLAYQRARELQLRGNYQQALPALISAQEMFVRLSDSDRANKVYGPIGQTYLELGKLPEAKDAFRRGLETARLSARRDSELINLIGLSEIAIRNAEIADARRMLNEAEIIALYLGAPDKAAEFRERANMLAKS